MQINVSQQLKSSIGSIREYEVNGIIDITGKGNSTRVQGKVNLMRTDRGILVKGVLDTGVGLTCSRCLRLFACPLVLNIEEEYFPITDVVTGTSLPSPDEPGSFTIDEQHVLNLAEAIRQYTSLATPMKPLCRTDCAGLCPTCGSNLNQAPCNCPPKPVDPRWAELSKFAPAKEQVTVNERKERGG